MTTKITFVGGVSQIGMNSLLLEENGQIVIIDCGLSFPEVQTLGIEKIIPDISFYKNLQDKIIGLVVTHGHEDHIGAIPYLLKELNSIDVYTGEFAAYLLKSKLGSFSFNPQIIRHMKKFQIGNFKFTPVSMQHSIVNNFGFIIETSQGNIFHAGDFKLDETKLPGCDFSLNNLKKVLSNKILLYLGDSTNIERAGITNSEKDLIENFEKIFNEQKSKIFITFFSSNVVRVLNFLTIAKNLQKKVVLCGNSIKTHFEMAKSLGYINEDYQAIIDILINEDEIKNYPSNKVIILCTGCQGETKASVIKFANREHKTIRVEKDDLVIFSSKTIPGNEKTILKIVNSLYKQGAKVLYNVNETLHCSGHAYRGELKTMFNLVKPKFFIPVHGEYRHLKQHAELAIECGISEKNIVVATDGDTVEISKESIRISGKQQIGCISIFSDELDTDVELSELLVKERKRMAFTGAVFILLVRDADGQKILYGPEIFTKGVHYENLIVDISEEVLEYIKQTVTLINKPASTLEEELKSAVRRYFSKKFDRKPLVTCAIVDL